MGATTVAVLGSTGSIGTQTLDVIGCAEGRFDVVALSASSSVNELVAQTVRFAPQAIAVRGQAEAKAALDALRDQQARGQLTALPDVLVGSDGLASLARDAEIVVNGVVGFAGLHATLAALTAGRRLALANKESLIAAGPLCARARRTPGAELLPVDSEHSAIHQCLATAPKQHVARLVLTASGGPFRGLTAADLAHVSLADALKHPTWNMGPKITVDSSTLMNKGLEVIEAHELFGVDYGQIDVVVHPQSIVHSMVTFIDGSTIAQMSRPDMRLPIGYALCYPDRLDVAFGSIDWARCDDETGLGETGLGATGFGETGLGGHRTLTFEPPDRSTFGCLDLAYEAGRAGDTAPAWLNGANEAAVAAFLAGDISWSAIASLIAAAMDQYDGAAADSIDAVVAADEAARRAVATLCGERSTAGVPS